MLGTSDSQDEGVELSPASRQDLPGSKRKYEMKTRCFSVNNNGSVKDFTEMALFFFPADCKTHLATPFLAAMVHFENLLRKIGTTFIFC